MTSRTVNMDDLRELMSRPQSAACRLSETEKYELREMAREGRPLYKILKSTLDFADVLKETIASAPLHTQEGVELARQLQLKRNASLEYVQWLVEQFDDSSPRNKQKD
jgi:hypothetical protein